MKHLGIIPALIIVALIVFNPSVTNSQPKESPKKPSASEVEIPKLIFKNPKQIGERWASIFVEGNKVGWKHVVRSKVFFNAKKVFLFEETNSITIGKIQCDIKRRAITDMNYRLIAFESVEETVARKIACRGITPLISGYSKIKGIEGVYVSQEVTDKARNISNKFARPVETPSASQIMPLFALIDIYLDMSLSRRNSLPKNLYLFDTLDLTTKTAMHQFAKGFETERGGKKVKMDALGVAISGEPQYWLLEEAAPEYWRSLHYPLTIRAAEREDDAVRPGGSDPDFKVDPALSPDQYSNSEIGLVFKRALGDWMIQARKIDDNLTSIKMKGLINRHTMAMLTVNNLPKGIKPADAEKRIRELMVENGLVKSLPKPVLKSKPGDPETIFSCEVKERYGISKLLGQYRCQIKGDRITAAVFLIPANFYDEKNAKAMDTLIKSILLKRVISTPRKFADTAKRISLKGYHPSWQLKQRKDGGVDVTNPWYYAKGEIFGILRKEGESTQAMLKRATQDMPKGGSRKETKISGIRAEKIFAIKTVKVEFKKKYLVKAWLIIGKKYVYRFKIQMPADMEDAVDLEIKQIFAKMNLKLR